VFRFGKKLNIMKKIFVTVFIMHLSICALQAQVINESKVPAAVKSGFLKMHPHAKPRWEKEEGNFEATFREGGNEISCVVDHQGIIVETETGIAPTDLPKSVLNYLNLHHKGEKIQEASKIVSASGDVSYEAKVKNRDLLFAADGHFIKESKEAND
jgi:hypothetical protein